MLSDTKIDLYRKLRRKPSAAAACHGCTTGVPRFIPVVKLARLMHAVRTLPDPEALSALLAARQSGAGDEIHRLDLDMHMQSLPMTSRVDRRALAIGPENRTRYDRVRAEWHTFHGV
jgi:hypothetical protein